MLRIIILIIIIITIIIIIIKVIPNFWSLVGSRILSSTQRKLFQTGIGFRNLSRILIDRFFNEVMEYSGRFFVIKFVHKIEMLV